MSQNGPIATINKGNLGLSAAFLTKFKVFILQITLSYLIVLFNFHLTMPIK
jgi:hypothetical protein